MLHLSFIALLTFVLFLLFSTVLAIVFFYFDSFIKKILLPHNVSFSFLSFSAIPIYMTLLKLSVLNLSSLSKYCHLVGRTCQMMNAATADVFKIIACIDGSTKGDLHLGQHELLIW